MPVITLLTDFGTRDHYAGVMKGVIARICPDATIVDITHNVEPYQIAQGAYLLARAWPWFPAGTIHVAVVDPGVGSRRRALVAEAAGHLFVLPDNGLLSRIGVENPVVRQIRNPELMLHPVSRTFHGRDVFAPAAAHLAAGVPAGDAGPLVDDWIRLPIEKNTVLHIDRFGNVITSLRPPAPHEIRVRDTVIFRFAATYSEAPDNSLFLIEGSGGYLEISLRQASAAERLGCHVGDSVIIEPDKS
jgi:S-adenosylmethionine hydrolase